MQAPSLHPAWWSTSVTVTRMRRRNQTTTLNQKSSRPDAQACQSHTELYSSTQSGGFISFTGHLPPSFRTLLNTQAGSGGLWSVFLVQHTHVICVFNSFFMLQYSVLNMAALCNSFPIWLCCNIIWSPVRGSMYPSLLSPTFLIGSWAVAHDGVRCAYWLIPGHLALLLHHNYVPFVPSKPLIILRSS